MGIGIVVTGIINIILLTHLQIKVIDGENAGLGSYVSRFAYNQADNCCNAPCCQSCQSPVTVPSGNQSPQLTPILVPPPLSEENDVIASNPKFTKSVYIFSIPWPTAGTTIFTDISATAIENVSLEYKFTSPSYQHVALSSTQDIIFLSDIVEDDYLGQNNVMILELTVEVVNNAKRSDKAVIVIIIMFPNNPNTQTVDCQCDT